MRTALLVLATLVFVRPSLIAQCPHQVAVYNPPMITEGGLLNCDGGTDLGDLRIGTRGTCPAIVVVTPGYHESQFAAGSNTYTLEIGSTSIRHYTYECATKWFLFIPIGSRCRQAKCIVAGELPLLQTIPCAPQGDAE